MSKRDPFVARVACVLGVPYATAQREYRHLWKTSDGAPGDQRVLEAHLFHGLSRDLSQRRAPDDLPYFKRHLEECVGIERVIADKRNIATVKFVSRPVALRAAACVGQSHDSENDVPVLLGTLDLTPVGALVRFGDGTVRFDFPPGPRLTWDEVRAERKKLAFPHYESEGIPESHQWRDDDVVREADVVSLLFRRLDALRGPLGLGGRVSYWPSRMEITCTRPGLWDLLDVVTAIRATTSVAVSWGQPHSAAIGKTPILIDDVELWVSLYIPPWPGAVMTSSQMKVAEGISPRRPHYGDLHTIAVEARLDREGRPR